MFIEVPDRVFQKIKIYLDSNDIQYAVNDSEIGENYVRADFESVTQAQMTVITNLIRWFSGSGSASKGKKINAR